MKQKINKKGFTLVELLSVLVILAVLALIAVPVVIQIINDSKQSSKIRSAELIEEAARLYVLNELKGENVPDTITLQELVNKGYVDARGEDLNNYVVVTRVGDSYTFSYSGRTGVVDDNNNNDDNDEEEIVLTPGLYD